MPIKITFSRVRLNVYTTSDTVVDTVVGMWSPQDELLLSVHTCTVADICDSDGADIHCRFSGRKVAVKVFPRASPSKGSLRWR